MIRHPKLIAIGLKHLFKPSMQFLPWGVQRWIIDHLSIATIPSAGVEKELIRLGKLDALRVRPINGAKRKILYFHGGGYCVGSYRSHYALLSHLALHCEAEVYCPRYALAPEQPFPAGLDDCFEAYKTLLGMLGETGKPFVAGDSAGGGLALATTQRIRDEALPLPEAVVLISPWLDIRCTAASHKERSSAERMLSAGWLNQCAAAYLADEAADNPQASPLFGELNELPPILIQTGTDEVLFDDSCNLQKRAEDTNTSVEFQAYEGMWHDFHALGNIVPQADVAIREIAKFIQAKSA